MHHSRNRRTLVSGLLLTAVGCLFLIFNLYDLRLSWRMLAQYLLPPFFLWIGGSKLVRHFWPQPEDFNGASRRASLLGGFFWCFVGLCLGLHYFLFLNVCPTLEFAGSYWPAIVILFGLGKIVDFYRLQPASQVQPRELLGLILVILLGLAAHKLARFEFPGLRFLRPLASVASPSSPVNVLVLTSINTMMFVANATPLDSRRDDESMRGHRGGGAAPKTGVSRRNPLGGGVFMVGST